MEPQEDSRTYLPPEQIAEPFRKINPNGWHHCDISIRRNGKDELYEADWLRDLYHSLFPPLDSKFGIAKALQNADVDDFDDIAKKLWIKLSPAEKETLKGLVESGPVWDGDVPSKVGRDGLINLGLASKAVVKGSEGYQVANYLGRAVYKSCEVKS